jgi:hypothetical protein
MATPLADEKHLTFSNDRLNFKHSFWAAQRQEKGIFWAFHSFLMGSTSARRLQSGDHPTADRGGEPVDCRLVENKPDWRLRQLFAIAYENAALPEQPHRSYGKSALIGIG